MTIKIFKKQQELNNFITDLKSDSFYRILDTEKGLFRTITKVLVFDSEDIENYLATQLNQILEMLPVKDFQEKIYLNDKKIYIKITCENQNSLLLQKYGYVVSAIQNLLISYLFSKFAQWYQISINVNNHLHNQKYFLKKQIYFAIKNIKEKNKPFHLKPMPNDQRKLVHNLVKEIDGFTSLSEGKGFLRHIVIKTENNVEQ
ncbi:MAG: R3H domain-containing nucleic acid-binding protein [Spiroplasma sp.]|nr:R3H domain-containing nucleic acid-binding protein [Spiroplasma sp.]